MQEASFTNTSFPSNISARRGTGVNSISSAPNTPPAQKEPCHLRQSSASTNDLISLVSPAREMNSTEIGFSSQPAQASESLRNSMDSFTPFQGSTQSEGSRSSNNIKGYMSLNQDHGSHVDFALEKRISGKLFSKPPSRQISITSPMGSRSLSGALNSMNSISRQASANSPHATGHASFSMTRQPSVSRSRSSAERERSHTDTADQIRASNGPHNAIATTSTTTIPSVNTHIPNNTSPYTANSTPGSADSRHSKPASSPFAVRQGGSPMFGSGSKTSKSPHTASQSVPRASTSISQSANQPSNQTAKSGQNIQNTHSGSQVENPIASVQSAAVKGPNPFALAASSSPIVGVHPRTKQAISPFSKVPSANVSPIKARVKEAQTKTDGYITPFEKSTFQVIFLQA